MSPGLSAPDEVADKPWAALDYAKAQHSVLMCNGLGERLKADFLVENAAAGAAMLLDQVRACAPQSTIRPEHVFFSGEDQPSFAENFVRKLIEEKFLVVQVNGEAKQQRDHFQASSDSLDWLGIARGCLKRRGRPIPSLAEAYPNLQMATRDHDKIVRMRAALSHRIHSDVDRLFACFLSPRQRGLEPFRNASLEMMEEERLSPAQLSRPPRLAQWLGRRGVEQPGPTANQLTPLAKDVLGPAPEQTVTLQQTLAQWVGLYHGLGQSIASLDREVAHWLAKTPGAWLTSIPGFGMTLAAGWTAQLGSPRQWRAVRQLCWYGGVVSRGKQTGGPDQEAVVGHVQQRCNKRFKNGLLQAVEKVRPWGPEDLRQTAPELEARGAHPEFAMAKRLVRLAKYLVVHGTVYRPKALMEKPKNRAKQPSTVKIGAHPWPINDFEKEMRVNTAGDLGLLTAPHEGYRRAKTLKNASAITTDVFIGSEVKSGDLVRTTALISSVPSYAK